VGAPPEEFGPYLVYEQIGIGGMASVHRAESTGIAGFRREVALKRMLPHVALNDEFVRSFVREARLASYLRHENVAQTYELGKVGDVYFIAMELVPGRNLRQILKHCAAISGRIPIPIALNILNQICDALDYAHNLCDDSGTKLGIIHRDVSPSNIIISDTGVAKLIDFGIAKASAHGMQTMSGMVKGKFGYMAPEYLEGRIDARADLFAIGVIGYELLTNSPLFTGADDMDTLMRLRELPVLPPSRKNPDVPLAIDEVVMTALARDPNRRWQHATALRTALTTLTKRLGLVAQNAQVVEWIDWVFTQQRQEDSSPEISISQQTRSQMKLPQASSSMTKLERPLGAEPMVTLLGTTDVKRPSQGYSSQRPSQPQPAQRPSQPQPTQRPSQPQPAQRTSGLSPAESGAITTPSISTTGPEVTAQAAGKRQRVTSDAVTIVSEARDKKKRRWGLWLLVFLLIAAGGAAAVVYYFGLPSFE
jgi:serine/threonine protein kinase